MKRPSPLITLKCLVALFFSAVAFMSSAFAATTTFDATLGAPGAPASGGTLLQIGLGDTARVNFASPFAATGDEVVRLNLSSPGLQFTVRAGQTDGAGNSTIVFTQTGLDSSGGTINFFSLLSQGCTGGCNFLEIETTGINFGTPPLFCLLYTSPSPRDS